MNVRNLLNMAVVVTPRAVSSTTRDEMGDPTASDGSPTTFAGYLWQTNAEEDTANAEQQSETFRLALERSAAGHVDGTDRVSVAGIPYEVIGTPHQATNPRTGLVEYVDMRVRRVR